MEEPVCQICQARKATVSYSCWRSGRFLDRTFVCLECSPKYEMLNFGGSGRLGRFIADAAILRAKEAGIDPTRGCPGCGKTLAEVMTDASVGCEVCYNHFASDIASAIASIHGWGAHVGKSPSG